MQLEHILQAHGLIGRGGGKSKDNLPPPPITNFKATVVGETIKLTWSNPNDTDFIGLLILGKNGGYPTDINDGNMVLNKSIEDGGTIPTETIDNNVTLGVRRYYRAFPYDWDKNYQTDTGQQVSEIVKISQLAPPPPSLASRTSTSITLSAISGCEYRIGTGAWQDSTVFSGLSIATNYTFYARRKETGTHYASPSSDGTTFATDKGTQSAPSAPTVSEIEHDRATVNGGSGTEVRLGSGSWYDSPHVFTGLSAETSYQAYSRRKETSIHYASPSSLAKSFTTPPEYDDIYGTPGAKNLISGTMEEGFFGEVSASEFITGDTLASQVGISQGTSQHSTTEWLKFAYKGEILFVAKKPIRHSISWDAINAAKCVYGDSGDKTVIIGGKTYKVTLMKGANDKFNPKQPISGQTGGGNGYNGEVNHGSEWNRLMCQIHEQALNKSWDYPGNVETDIGVMEHSLGNGNQGMYDDADLVMKSGDGRLSWCREMTTSISYRLSRGSGVSYSYNNTSSSSLANSGWRPRLVLVP